MARWIILGYGVIAYLLFGAVFVYMVGFLGNWVVPKSIDGAATGPLWLAYTIDAGWFVLFAIQHSGMARPAAKERLTRIIPAAAERSTYVLITSLLIVLLIWQWRPLPQVVWHVEAPAARIALQAISLAGWAVLFLSSCLIDHFELFGLKQVYLNLSGRTPAGGPFRTPSLYKVVRHPMYLGFVVAFWVTPDMTAGHLLFASGMTAYLMLGIHFEERALVRHFGDEYRDYQDRVPMLFPIPRLRRRERASRD